MQRELGDIQFINSNKGRHLPTVFTHDEAMRVLSFMAGDHRLASCLMYGSGLRIMEAVRLRIQDVDFANACLFVRETKGDKWRRTLLPKMLIEPLKVQIDLALAIHQQDVAEGFGEVYYPMRWQKNILKRVSVPPGNMFFRLPIAQLIPVAM